MGWPRVDQKHSCWKIMLEFNWVIWDSYARFLGSYVTKTQSCKKLIKQLCILTTLQLCPKTEPIDQFQSWGPYRRLPHQHHCYLTPSHAHEKGWCTYCTNPSWRRTKFWHFSSQSSNFANTSNVNGLIGLSLFHGWIGGWMYIVQCWFGFLKCFVDWILKFILV